MMRTHFTQFHECIRTHPVSWKNHGGNLGHKCYILDVNPFTDLLQHLINLLRLLLQCYAPVEKEFQPDNGVLLS